MNTHQVALNNALEKVVSIARIHASSHGDTALASKAMEGRRFVAWLKDLPHVQRGAVQAAMAEAQRAQETGNVESAQQAAERLDAAVDDAVRSMAKQEFQNLFKKMVP
jgi:hypothetical protein